MASITLKVTEIYDKNWDALTNKKYKTIINQAGTRSGKTYAILQCIVMYCHMNPNKKVSIVRISLPALRDTVIPDFIEILTSLNIYDLNNHNKTEQLYTFSNGSNVKFLSADNAMRLKGSKRDLLFLNEATELSQSVYMQLAMRTSGKILIDFNPEDIDHWVYDLMKDKDSLTIKSTYKDNPFLETSQVKFIEDKIKVDANWYKTYVLGERPTSSVRIYNHFQQYDEEIVDINKNNFAYGLDFGYNHPTVLVKCYFEGDAVYVKEEIYRSNMTVSDLISLMNVLNIDKTKDIYCDSARPEIIEEIKRAGYVRAQGSDKNVKSGIDKIKSMEVLIEKLSKNVWKEYRTYCWKVNGEHITDEPVKLNDDAMDAMRYCVHTFKKTKMSVDYVGFF